MERKTHEELNTLKNTELVSMYNEAMVVLGQATIVKFRDKETAVRRTFVAVEEAVAKQEMEATAKKENKAEKTIDTFRAIFAANFLKKDRKEVVELAVQRGIKKITASTLYSDHKKALGPAPKDAVAVQYIHTTSKRSVNPVYVIK